MKYICRSTSLHLAIKANRIVEVAELLRHYGKDIVNIKNDHNGTGNTPLHEAMLVNNPEMVKNMENIFLLYIIRYLRKNF